MLYELAGWPPGSKVASWVLSLNLRCVLMLQAVAAVPGPGLPRLVLLGSPSLVSGENQTSQGRVSRFQQIRPGSRTGGG